MAERIALPEITHRERMSEVLVDATPDGGYALRILRAFRRRCDCRWAVEGLPENERLIWDAMNEAQERRAEELDAAIRILGGEEPTG